ncbi:hypothetical protein ES319_D05G428500v1 [Gossypium barbadense]|uniref:Uncharacterized protein n=1 Tax=Gossypium barbadense TaxID=3634 RepID=A0A5J5RPU8_GOSBA|nr:hypothetical protein ES319_D05G428500v1 [Gossypium barbadense]
MLNPTGSLDLRRLTYSSARASPASKWVNPFCSGTCLATFSLWKLKNTNLPKKRERAVLTLIITWALSSALIASLALAAEFLEKEMALDEDLPLLRGLRPWNEMLEGVTMPFFFWTVEKIGVNKAEEAAMVPALKNVV